MNMSRNFEERLYGDILLNLFFVTGMPMRLTTDLHFCATPNGSSSSGCSSASLSAKLTRHRKVLNLLRWRDRRSPYVHPAFDVATMHCD